MSHWSHEKTGKRKNGRNSLPPSRGGNAEKSGNGGHKKAQKKKEKFSDQAEGIMLPEIIFLRTFLAVGTVFC